MDHSAENAILIAEARVETRRSSRYLVQVCKHVSHIAQKQPEMEAHVEWSEERGVISFAWGRCTLRADPDALMLRAEASDEEHLQRVEHRVTELLERVGRRDHLSVTWRPAQGEGERLPRQPSGATQDDKRGHARGRHGWKH
jgi:hypothetical protein